MSGSKTSRKQNKNGCQCKYIYVRGDKEGEQCNAPSRGDYCKNHNQNRKKYQEKYFERKSRKNMRSTSKQRLKKVQKININNRKKYEEAYKTLVNVKVTYLKWVTAGWRLVNMRRVYRNTLEGNPHNEEDKKNIHTSKIINYYLNLECKANKENEDNENYEGFSLSDREIKKINENLEKIEKQKIKIINKVKEYETLQKILEEKIHEYRRINNIQ